MRETVPGNVLLWFYLAAFESILVLRQGYFDFFGTQK